MKKPRPLLNGLSASEFLRDYWQKKPLLIRQALPQFVEPLNRQEIFELAGREEADSRLIVRRDKAWTLQHGPFSARDFRALKNELWTVLVQDIQHFSAEAHALLAHFNFIPYARIDDLMVSYAVKGAGVGPHIDSYDVFLLQGSGRRRWQISGQADTTLKPNMPLKILARFKPEQEWVLEPGDMLYLPPGYAHNGVAETDCHTWSIGFRAPTQQELATAFIDYLRDTVCFEGNYTDPDLTPTTKPGEISTTLYKRMAGLLKGVAEAARNNDHMQRFIGSYLSEPKAQVYFDTPEKQLSQAAFRRMAQAQGLVLDGQTRLLYQSDQFFINGEVWPVVPDDAQPLQQLADQRRLSAASLCNQPSPSLWATLYGAYCDGYLHMGTS
ncbi:MAG: cupin domain-containing protein [Betaproteobacteria bacterium]|nr:cupin domain-containing protein [Betaproteobacteria bacterium]